MEVTLPVQEGRQIRWQDRAVAERLEARRDDLRRAIALGAAAVADGLPSVQEPEGWQLTEVAATFGISFAADAGVIVSKASVGATVEVSVTFARARE